MKLLYINWILLALYISQTDTVKLSKKITNLLQEVLDENTKDEQQESNRNNINLAKKDTHTKQVVTVKNAEEFVKKETKKMNTIDVSKPKEVKKSVVNPEENNAHNDLSHDNKLVQKLTNLLQDLIDASRKSNTTLEDDIEEIMDNDVTKTKVRKRKDHPHQCMGGAFDKAVDNIADIIKEGIKDKLMIDFNQQFDEDDEEIFRKAKKNANPTPWLRRRHWWGKKK